MRALLDAGPLVVVDEAYFEFHGRSLLVLLAERDNLVVLRTMSKWAGIAGLRVGYALAHPDIVDALMAVKIPYNLSSIAETAVVASLDDADVLLARRQDDRRREGAPLLVAGRTCPA